jgi:hypothetical protein
MPKTKKLKMGFAKEDVVCGIKISQLKLTASKRKMKELIDDIERLIRKHEDKSFCIFKSLRITTSRKGLVELDERKDEKEGFVLWLADNQF